MKTAERKNGLNLKMSEKKGKSKSIDKTDILGSSLVEQTKEKAETSHLRKQSTNQGNQSLKKKKVNKNGAPAPKRAYQEDKN